MSIVPRKQCIWKYLLTARFWVNLHFCIFFSNMYKC